jgi:hypothetical protein
VGEQDVKVIALDSSGREIATETFTTPPNAPVVTETTKP